ncbi:unnamed protein product [Rhizoctonia solani]|uniref:Uncharacterized protein n=1 Tax=Rhizoctonia solani TaxID=456999 RepID=A0A8H3I0L1_9AGAM|nr:unnamed protein product [Rhizoctonia solani]
MARRRSILPLSPEPYLPKRDPSSKTDETNTTLGPRGSNDHFARSSTATLTEPLIPEHIERYFLSLPPDQFHLALERVRNDYKGSSSAAFDGTLPSSSSSQSRPPDSSNLDSMSVRFKYRTPSSRPTKPGKIASWQPHSNTTGPSKRLKVPEPEEREYIEISSGDEGGAGAIDDEDEHSDDEFE